MKLFTYLLGSINVGTQITVDKKYGKCVFLGRKAKGCRFEAVSLDNKDTPTIHKGECIQNAYPRTLNFKSKKSGEDISFTVLSKPFGGNKNGKVLLRVCTNSPSKKDFTDGKWISLAGKVHVVKSAIGRDGDGNKYCDDLIVMSPDDVIRIHNLGARVNDFTIIKNVKGNLKKITPAEYDASLKSEPKSEKKKAKKKVEKPVPVEA